MDNEHMDNELAALIEHMEARNIEPVQFAHLCAVSIGSLIYHGCDDNNDKAVALASVVRTVRDWANMPAAH